MNRTTCPICADYFTVKDCTACPCGHTFHFNCIQRWKVESSTCPQCRVKFKEPIKLYFEQNCDDTINECDTSELKNEIRELKLQVTQKDALVNNLTKQFEISKEEVTEKVEQIALVQQMLRNSQGTNDALKRQISYLEKYKAEAQRARAQSASLEKELTSYQNIKEMVSGERSDVELMVKNYADTPDSLNTVVKSFVLLKKEFDKMRQAKKKLESDRTNYRRKAEEANKEAYENQKKVDVLSNDITHLDQLNKSLQLKLRKLEQSFASPSPRSSAIKRLLMESPAPVDLKRPRMSNIGKENADDNNDGSLILFDNIENERPDTFDNNVSDEEQQEEEEEEEDDDDDDEDEEETYENNELLKEFGLKNVSTTSKASGNNNRSSSKNNTLPSNNRSTATGNKFPLKTSSRMNTASGKNKSGTSSLPHLKKGYNGLGGQSKVLCIPKKTSSGFKKPAPVSLKQEHRKMIKVSRNNPTISKFLNKAPKLPTIQLSP